MLRCNRNGLVMLGDKANEQFFCNEDFALANAPTPPGRYDVTVHEVSLMPDGKLEVGYTVQGGAQDGKQMHEHFGPRGMPWLDAKGGKLTYQPSYTVICADCGRSQTLTEVHSYAEAAGHLRSTGWNKTGHLPCDAHSGIWYCDACYEALEEKDK